MNVDKFMMNLDPSRYSNLLPVLYKVNLDAINSSTLLLV